MDPASASVACIGVAASLTTLAALVIDCSKTLYRVGSKLKKAPADITRLLTQLKLFERLLSEAQQRIEDHGPEYVAPDVGTLFTIAAERMLEDVRNLEGAIRKLEILLSGPASPRNTLLLRVRYILKEDRVQEFQRFISSHVATLTLLLEILNR